MLLALRDRLRPQRVRAFAPRDALACHATFREAVLHGAARKYTTSERAAWAGTVTPPERWGARLSAAHCWVAPGIGRRIDGFLSMGYDGHIDLFYVRPDRMGKGTAAALYDAAVAQARRMELALMTTEASLLARAFLERRNWQVEARQSVIRHGVAITNFRMFLPL